MIYSYLSKIWMIQQSVYCEISTTSYDCLSFALSVFNIFISDFLISRACILCSMHHYVTYKYFCLYETRKDGYNPVSHFYTAYHWLPIPPVLQKEWPHDEWCAGQRFSTNLPTPNWFSPGMWGNKNQINWKPTILDVNISM